MPRLFLIDDDESNRLTLEVLFEDAGFEIVTADSVADARAKIESGVSSDVVILDHNLGDGYGTDLVPLLREKIPGARLVLVSGASELVNANVDLALAKGDDAEKLINKVKALVGA